MPLLQAMGLGTSFPKRVQGQTLPAARPCPEDCGAQQSRAEREDRWPRSRCHGNGAQRSCLTARLQFTACRRLSSFVSRTAWIFREPVLPPLHVGEQRLASMKFPGPRGASEVPVPSPTATHPPVFSFFPLTPLEGTGRCQSHPRCILSDFLYDARAVPALRTAQHAGRVGLSSSQRDV